MLLALLIRAIVALAVGVLGLEAASATTPATSAIYSYDSVVSAGAGVAYPQADGAPDLPLRGGSSTTLEFDHRYDDVSNLARASSRVDRYGSAPRSTPPRFSQTTASPTFRHGPLAGQTIGDVAGGLRAGKLSAGDLPVDVIVRNGETIGLNTRSMLALRRGGIDPSDWLLNDVTGVPGMERRLTERPLRNQLTGGTDVLRITGAGPNASNLL